jgi:NADH:ubiquinone oxidoreductase subunit F (NADH-binding)
MIQPRLLAGPPAAAGPEPLFAHEQRLGALPRARRDLIPVLTNAGLLGRGGASFPVGRKWAAVAGRAEGDARVLANGAEGEPLSAKDRTLMAARPQLVLDGALLAAEAVGAREVVLYVGERHVQALMALERALGERRALPVPVRIVRAPHAYVAGEESAAVHYINAGDARPTVVPPRPFERGIDGRPTLVQNVETLANVALIARFGDAWFRELGRGETRGTALVTVTGAPHGGVREIELGTRVGELAQMSGLRPEAADAVLLGGYFGRWAARHDAWGLPLDPGALRSVNATLGAGVVSFLAADQCGVAATATVLDYMAAQSAAQCGPCVFGLRSIADTTHALARGGATPADLGRLDRWAGQVHGRGACRHPDGAIGLLLSAMDTFAADFDSHARRGGCQVAARTRAAA